MKKFAIQAIVLIILIFLGLGVYTSRITNIPFVPQTAKTTTVLINGTALKVEVADTPQLRNKGLGGRESLASDSGMLFIFSSADKYPFWMKGLNFPLDFIWIRGNTVVDFLQSIKPPGPGQPDQSLTIYAPKVPIDKVLEAPAGTISRLNIKVGNTVRVVQ